MVFAVMEPMNRNFWRAVLAEFLAMFLLVFVGVGCCLTSLGIARGSDPNAKADATMAVSLCFGLITMALTYVFAPISGAHMNPVVTISMLMRAEVSYLRAFVLIIIQVSASILASLALMVVMGLDRKSMGGFNTLLGYPHERNVPRAFGLEVILTGVVVGVHLTTSSAKRTWVGPSPVAVGLAVGVAHLIAVPLTGCGINPARSIGPALVSSWTGADEHLWLFLSAPLLGGVAATILWYTNVELGDYESLPLVPST